MTFSVLIAADDLADRGALREALQAGGCRILGECPAGQGAIELARQSPPDVVVLAWAALDAAELQLLLRLRAELPASRIVVSSVAAVTDAARLTLDAVAATHVEADDFAELVHAVMRPTPDRRAEMAGIVAGLRAPGTKHRSQSPQGPGPFRVLLVDDDLTARRLLRLSLELEGAAVTEAVSLAQAHELLDQHFDGVVLDRRLPDGDGLDLLPVLAKRHPHASIVVCSNFDDNAEPWYVLHVPKTDMESVVSALGLVRRDHPSILGLPGSDHPDAAVDLSADGPLTDIVRRWTTGLGRQAGEPPTPATHGLISALVRAIEPLEAGTDEEPGAAEPEGRRQAEVTVRQLVGLRELVTGELERLLGQDGRSGPLAAVNRELDTWILAVVSRDVERLRRRASTDPLTGLLNRWAFDEALTLEVARAARHRRPFSVAMADLDGLKAINDRDGHPAGDAALVRMAQAIRGSLRVSDSAYRVGGDEFVILLPETPKRVVQRVIERIEAGGAPSFSWGAATYLEDTDDTEQVIDLADRQLLARRHASRF